MPTHSVANKTIEARPPPGHQLAKKSIVGPVVGGIIGGLALISIVVLGAFLWRRRAARQFSPTKASTYDAGIEPEAVPYDYNPYAGASQNPLLNSLTQPQPQFSESPSAPPVTLGVSGIISSSKAREAAGYLTHATPPSTVASGPSSSTGPASSREPPTEFSTPSVGPNVSPLDVAGLRVEVENLRRVMQEMQIGQLEAPPGYNDIQTQSSNVLRPANPSASEYSQS